jgi:hypothetical protein
MIPVVELIAKPAAELNIPPVVNPAAVTGDGFGEVIHTGVG